MSGISSVDVAGALSMVTAAIGLVYQIVTYRRDTKKAADPPFAWYPQPAWAGQGYPAGPYAPPAGGPPPRPGAAPYAAPPPAQGYAPPAQGYGPPAQAGPASAPPYPMSPAPQQSAAYPPPAHPAPPGQPVVIMPLRPPRAVNLARLFLGLAMFLGFLGSVICELALPQARFTTEAAPDMKDVITVVVVITVLLGGIYVCFLSVASVYLGRGRQWARILVWIVCGLMTVCVLPGMFGGGSSMNADGVYPPSWWLPVYIMTSLVYVIFLPIVAILLARPTAHQFFAEATRRRRAGIR